MENVCFASLCCCLLILAGTEGQQAGDVEIEKCNSGFIDIQENANNTVLCKVFNRKDIIAWAFRRTGEEIRQAVATCYASSNCTVHQPDHFAVERSPSHSTLFYQQYDRELDKDATVTCQSLFGETRRSMECNVNVINPAKLSSCTVEEDHEKVSGRCRFDHAYSFSREFICTWYQEKDGKPTGQFPGHISFTSGSEGPSGWCNFTTIDLAWSTVNSTYSILFYPGPGKVTVDTGHQDGQPFRALRIENCIDRFIDIRENANNTIPCKGFYPNDTIVWKVKRHGEISSEKVATCDPSKCTVHQPDHFAVERSPSHSTLFYQQYDRQVDAFSLVSCESQFADGLRSTSCTLNVINPANLSSCSVVEDRDRGTVRGRCRFDYAYSYHIGFQCTWFQETDAQSKRFIGNIEYDSGPQSPSGVCNFTSTDLDSDPGNYTYSILFYPGPGNITVNVENTESSTSQEKSSSSIAAIVGGCVGVVVVIVVAVVIVVVKIKLRDKTYAKPARRPRNAEPEHPYNDLHSNTATTTTTTATTPSYSITTTTDDLHNTTTNKHRGQGKKSDNVHHNPVYVNENQPGEESSGVQQHPTYANDYPETAQGYVEANRDSNPYYSEIKDTGIN